MSNEEFEQRFQHHVEFMLEQQARFDERVSRLEESQVRQAENLDRLAESVSAMQVEMRDGFNNLITEMREGFNNLIVANEVTRDLAEKATSLAIQTSHRVTKLEPEGS